MVAVSRVLWMVTIVDIAIDLSLSLSIERAKKGEELNASYSSLMMYSNEIRITCWLNFKLCYSMCNTVPKWILPYYFLLFDSLCSIVAKYGVVFTLPLTIRTNHGERAGRIFLIELAIFGPHFIYYIWILPHTQNVPLTVLSSFP